MCAGPRLTIPMASAPDSHMNQTAHADVVIIGAGHAGAELAVALRRKGFGGSILMIGAESAFPYQRPPLSKDYLLEKTGRDRLALRPEGYWRDASIGLELGRAVVSLDKAASRIQLDDGRSIGFDWCVLATGGRARRLNCPGADLAGIHTLRTLADVDAIRAELDSAQALAVIGAGFIGLEFAAVARHLGKDVTVIEALPRLLSRATSPLVSDFFERQHRRHGVQFRFGHGVAACEGGDRISAVVLDDGSRIAADMAIVGIGIDAETALAETAGLDCDGGLLVDECFRTSAPNILAIGDCARHPNPFAGGLWRLESVQHAQDSAAGAADTIMGSPAPYHSIPTFWSDQYDLRLQTAGLSKDADDIQIRGDTDQGPFSAIYLRDGKVIAIDAINSARDFMAARKLIAEGARPDPAKLADASLPLKALA